MAWNGDSMSRDGRWLLQLNDTEINEIISAVEASYHSQKPIGSLERSNFPFKTFADRLSALREEVQNGCGFAVLRGIPAGQWSDEDLIRACWGICLWIGEPVIQNAKAHVLDHITNRPCAGFDDKNAHQTNRAQPFQSDPCDISAQFCLRTAKHGGASSIASSAAIHNELIDIDPQALEQLYNSFDCQHTTATPPGSDQTYSARVFSDLDNHLICSGLDTDIHLAQQIEKVPRLTDEQTHALEAFQKAASNLALNVMLERGDIQFSNNLTTVHARKTFVDYSDPDKRRHFIRLWLSSKHGPRLPEFLSARRGNIEAGSVRGGVCIPGAAPIVNVSPEH